MNIGKQKGGTFERKIAKELSEWMFNENPNVLFRHASSGARKKVYSGDIVPEDEIAHFGWKIWPFNIELKTGYPIHTPYFDSENTKLKEWLYKLINELNEKQKYPIFIWQLYKRHPILLTTLILNKHWNLVLNLPFENGNVYWYCYLLKDLLNYNFFDLLPLEIKNEILEKK